jgi:hypothetical protein
MGCVGSTPSRSSCRRTVHEKEKPMKYLMLVIAGTGDSTEADHQAAPDISPRTACRTRSSEPSSTGRATGSRTPRRPG